MKKFGIILGLSFLAVGAFAQYQNAELYQLGVKNSALIDQSGFAQSATVTQIGYNNGARVLQDGAFNYAEVTQLGWKNYASLEQDGIFASGSILQIGAKNLAAVKQESFSSVKVEQFGFGNILASASRNALRFEGCRHPRVTYGEWCFNRCNLAIPSPFSAVKVGVGDQLKVKQTGEDNVFLTFGELGGTQKVKQMGERNLIILGQDKGKSDLNQVGSENYIWLSMKHAKKADIDQYGYKNLVALNLEKGKAKIEQVGANNKVAYFGRGICQNCPTEPASFQGDNLYVKQLGSDNKLSLKSESAGSDVTVVQIGHSNYGTVIQSNMGHGFEHGCNNCGD